MAHALCEAEYLRGLLGLLDIIPPASDVYCILHCTLVRNRNMCNAAMRRMHGSGIGGGGLKEWGRVESKAPGALALAK
jgi:hypothetical protein